MKKNKILIRVMMIIVICLSVNLSYLNVSADDGGEPNVSLSKTVVFDLNKILFSDSRTITTEAGNKETFTIERDLDTIGKYQPNVVVKNKTYTISRSTATENISYKIVVNNNKIVSAHSGKYSIFGYTVRSSRLYLINSKNASYDLECSLLFYSWTSSLKSRINAQNELVVTFD